MPTSLVDAESILALDIGSMHTRALLFDVVDGQYAFVAAGISPSTYQAPFNDIGEGVYRAINHLEEITGRAVIGGEGRILIPAQPDGHGVDRMVLTYSGGPELRVVVAGLLGDVSLDSARRLVDSTYGRVAETISLTDRRKTEAQMDAIRKAEPDIILLAGGTEGGASRSVFKLADLVALVSRVLPKENRPEVIYVGNSALGSKIKDGLQKWLPVQVAPNIRPTIDLEDLRPAQDALSQVITRIRQRQLGGLTDLTGMCTTPPIPTATAVGRMVTFLSQLFDVQKAVLAVDLGAGFTTAAVASNGRLALNVLNLGMGQGAKNALEQIAVEDIASWLPGYLPVEIVRDLLWDKTLHPGTIPVTVESLAIEQAFARMILQQAMQNLLARWNGPVSFERILAGGAVLTHAANPAQSMLLLLDGLQPVGISQVLLDQNNILPAMGAVAAFNHILPVQVFESGAFFNLGTVIAPVSDERYGTPILKIRMEYGQGNENRYEVRQGSLMALPLAVGQAAEIEIQALKRTQIDPTNRKSTIKLKVIGGACGVVIDARGRPLNLPPDDARRREMIKKWIMALGG